MILDAVRMLLRGIDLDLCVAANGEDGIVQAEMVRPDLILLDVQMPGMDGYETCRCIRAESWGAHVPIVLASADLGPRERELGIAAGCSDFLEKPFDKPRLYALIEPHLEDDETRP